MTRYFLIVVLYFGMALAQSRSAIAQTSQSHTPIGYLSRAAGIYLGANNYMEVLALSKCRGALGKRPPTTERLLKDKILPAFPEGRRREAEESFARILSIGQEQAQQYVSMMISAALADNHGEVKVACAYVAGMLVGMYVSAENRWVAEVRRFKQR